MKGEREGYREGSAREKEKGAKLTIEPKVQPTLQTVSQKPTLSAFTYSTSRHGGPRSDAERNR